MAPLKPVKKDAADKQMQHVLEYTSKTVTLLNDRSDIPSRLMAELEAIVRRPLPSPASISPTISLSTLDALGTNLWNAATNVVREQEHDRDPHGKRTEPAHLTAVLRILAFLLIHLAHESSHRPKVDCDQSIRAFKIGLKACRYCLEHEEPELALKALEGCADHVSAVEEALPIVKLAKERVDGGDKRRLALKHMVTEFYLLRMAHACRTDQAALADHLYEKVLARDLSSSCDLAEKAADLFHGVGKGFSSKSQVTDAVKWCERALAVLDTCDIAHLSQDAPELRLAITTTMVNLISSQESPDAIELLARAVTLVEQLIAVHGLGNRITVSLLNFKLHLKMPQSDEEHLIKILLDIIKLAVLTDKSFMTIMQAIHKSHYRYAGCALSALEELLVGRLLSDAEVSTKSSVLAIERLERVVITYTKFVTSESHTRQDRSIIMRLGKLFDVVSQHSLALSARATHAAQTLLWKTAGAAETSLAFEWYNILRHAIFENAGDLNKAKIYRKGMMLAMARSEDNDARQIFFQMPAKMQDESISRYLAFKLALRQNDFDFARESLVVVSKYAAQDPKFLYACVLDAQQSDLRMLAVAALQYLLDNRLAGVHIPSLLRCTARLLIGELDQPASDTNEVMQQIVSIFERAAENATSFRQGSDEQWQMEMRWWSKNAYNLALRLCGDLHPELLVRILSVCVKFLDILTSDNAVMHEDGTMRRKGLCHFLSATALLVLARSDSDRSEYGLQCYINARKHIAAFIADAPHLGRASRDSKDFQARAFELLKFDLECILRLEQWDELDQAIRSLLDYEHSDRWETLIDLTLVIHDHANAAGRAAGGFDRIPQLLQKCINKSWKKDQDIIKMSRWLRLTFTIHLHDERTDFTLTLLQQAAGIAQRGDHGKSDRYPETELQWLAITAFNKAVDLLSAGDTDETEKWVQGALELARYADDGGALHAHLTERSRAAEQRARQGIV